MADHWRVLSDWNGNKPKDKEHSFCKKKQFFLNHAINFVEIDQQQVDLSDLSNNRSINIFFGISL